MKRQPLAMQTPLICSPKFHTASITSSGSSNLTWLQKMNKTDRCQTPPQNRGDGSELIRMAKRVCNRPSTLAEAATRSFPAVSHRHAAAITGKNDDAAVNGYDG
jgi:hypothetical protein